MKLHKPVIAMFAGAGFASIVVLLLNLPVLSLPLSLFLLPGGLLAALIPTPSDSNEVYSAMALPVLNAVVYSAIAYALIHICCRRVAAEQLRRATLWLAAPVMLLVGLTWVPAFNPLWPAGMRELEAQEKGLQAALPLGMELERSRAVLRSKGIEFQEETESSQTTVVDEGNGKKVIARPGDRVISSRLQTAAGQFPCGYLIQIVLLFGADGRMNQQYIHRLRVCP